MGKQSLRRTVRSGSNSERPARNWQAGFALRMDIVCRACQVRKVHAKTEIAAVRPTYTSATKLGSIYISTIQLSEVGAPQMAKRGQIVRRAPAGRKGPTKSKISSPKIKSESGNADLKRKLAKARRELTEARQQQTATADVLKVISHSTLDLNPNLEAVLEMLLESAIRLCGAMRGHVYRYDGEFLRFAAASGAWPGFRDWLQENPLRLDRGSIAGRAGLEREGLPRPGRAGRSGVSPAGAPAVSELPLVAMRSLAAGRHAARRHHDRKVESTSPSATSRLHLYRPLPTRR